jgi:hypothetical protein
MVGLWSFLRRSQQSGVDETKRIRRLEVLQDGKPGGTPQIMIKTARYFENLHGERQINHDLTSL